MSRTKKNTDSPSGTNLTDKQRLFVFEYLTCWNATEAARRAGYQGDANVLGVTGFDNLRNPKIAAEVQRRMAEKAMPADEVLARLADQARGTIGAFIHTDETGKPSGFSLTDDRPLHIVKKVSITDKGWSFEMYDAQAALVHIGKHHGLFVDRTEITGKNGAPLDVTSEKLDQAAKELSEWRDRMTKQLNGSSAPQMPPTPAMNTE